MIDRRFVIVNTCDSPSRRNVAELVEGVGYCYMAREQEPYLKQFDGMNPSRPTPITDFGFTVDQIADGQVYFRRVSKSMATYEDGKPRMWQDVRHNESFNLPLVVGVKHKARRRLR